MKKNLPPVLLIFLIGFMSCGQSKSDLDGSLLPANNGERKIYINTKGETVLTPEENLNETHFFYADRALVRLEDYKGFIDKSGKMVIPCKYKYATRFSKGLAWVVAPDSYPIAIDPSGKTIIEMPNAATVYTFIDGLAVFQDKSTAQYGVIDREGKEIIAPKYRMIIAFDSESIAFRTEEGLWGIMDRNEKITIIPQFEAISPFSNKKYAIVTASDNKKGVINSKGEYVIKPVLKDIIPDGELFLVQTDNGLFGWMNAQDQYVINPQYTFANVFNDNDLTAVSTVAIDKSTKTLQMGYINKKGEEKIRPQFELATHFYNGVAKIRIGDKFGLINKEGNIVVNPQFSEIELPLSLMFSGYDIQSVSSDYFDYAPIVSNLLDVSQDGTFRGFNNATTFADLKAKYGDKLVRRTGSSCNVKEPIKLSDDASITETTFNFDKTLESRDYNFYSKEYETVTHEDAVLTSVKFKIELKKNWSKRDDLIEKISRHMIDKFKIELFEERDDEYYIPTDKMAVNVDKGAYGEIAMEVEFK